MESENLDYVHGSDLLVGIVEGETFNPLGHSKTCAIVFYGDGMGYDKLLEMWENGKPVPVKYALRGEEDTKFRQGNFIITSLEEVSAADDDATYSISLENSGPVETKTVAPKA